jgi:TnpA family transposase
MPAGFSGLLTTEQRLFFSQIPSDLAESDIARYYTLPDDDLAVIKRQHGERNRLGFAVQLCVLRYPGRPLTDLLDIPAPVLSYIAKQVGTEPMHSWTMVDANPLCQSTWNVFDKASAFVATAGW